MKKKQTKSKSPVHQHPPAIETPRFKEKASQLSQPTLSPQIIRDSEYFSFGGLDQPLQQPPLKKTSKSVYECNGKPKKLDNSFEKKIVTSKPPKVQIFNNNYQIININQIDKKDSIRSLQKQFQQILDNQVTRKLTTPSKTSQSPQPLNSAKTPPSASNYFNVQRLKKPGQTTILRKNLSPKVKNIKFVQNSASRCKTEVTILHQKPMINLKQILKDQKSISHYTQIDSTRTFVIATDSQKKFLLSKRGSRIVLPKPKQHEELEKIKQKFIKLMEKWHQREENYLKEQAFLKQEIARLNVIIQHLTIQQLQSENQKKILLA